MSEPSTFELLTECTELLEKARHSWHDPVLLEILENLAEVVRRIA